MQTETELSIVSDDTEKPAHRVRRRNWWLMPRPFNLVSSGFYLGVLIPFLLNFAFGQEYHGQWWRALGMVCTILLLFAIDRLEYWRYGEETPTRSAIFLLIVRILVIEFIIWLDRDEYSPALTVYIPLQASMYFGSLVAFIMAGLACVDYTIHHLIYTPDWLSNATEFHYDVIFVLTLILTLVMVSILLREKASRTQSEQLLTELQEAHRQLEELHQQLQNHAEQVEELAATRERNRLARDIHDSLGHYLTIINVQLEKALAFHQRKPDEAEQAMRDAKRLASEALQDVRRSVSTLRATQETFTFIPAVTSIVERYRTNQLSIDLSIEGSEDGYSKQGLLVLYRAMQEGLTNIQKHAGASRVQVEIQFGSCEATLRLQDNGRGFEPERLTALQPGREGGYGLQGVRERLELVGGRLQLESKPGEGTCLLVAVPKTSLASPLPASVEE